MVIDVPCRDSYKVYVIECSVFTPALSVHVASYYMPASRNIFLSGRITAPVVPSGKVPIFAKWWALERKEDLATLVLHSHFPAHLFSTSLWSSSKCDYFCPHFILNKLFSHMRCLLLTFVFTSLSLFLTDLLSSAQSAPLQLVQLSFPHSCLLLRLSITPVLPPSNPPLPSLPPSPASPGLLSRPAPVYIQLLMIRTAHKILTQWKLTCACLCLGMSLSSELQSRYHAMHSSSWFPWLSTAGRCAGKYWSCSTQSPHLLKLQCWSLCRLGAYWN